MTFNPDIHHRHSIRLRGFDYSSAGAYFVTICALDRECLFGKIVGATMQLSDVGRVVESVWGGLPDHFAGIRLNEYVIMPNHFHGILQITASVGAKQGSSASHDSYSPGLNSPDSYVPRSSASPGYGDVVSNKGKAGGALALPLHGTSTLAQGTLSGSLSAVIQNFKSVSTRKANKIRNNKGWPLWQRNYYERVVRNETELNNIRNYIACNPAQWADDAENPARHSQGPP